MLSCVVVRPNCVACMDKERIPLGGKQRQMKTNAEYIRECWMKEFDEEQRKETERTEKEQNK